MWNKASFSVFMAKNSNGSKKKNPFFWTPKKPEVEIFGNQETTKDNDHGRAIIMVEDEADPSKTVVIALYSDKLIIQSSSGSVSTLNYQDF